MKITRFSAFQLDLPLHEGRYAWSSGKSVDVFDYPVVKVETDVGCTRFQLKVGGAIVTAAIAHLAHSTPKRHRFTATDFNSYVTKSIAEGAPQRREGTMQAAARPGQGVEPIADVLREPVLVFE